MLKLCKILLAKLYLWPLSTSSSMKTTSIFRYSVNLSIELIVFITSFVYVLKNLQDIDEATEPGFACFAILTSMFIYVWMISQKQLISSSIDHLEFCINESNDFSSTIQNLTIQSTSIKLWFWIQLIILFLFQSQFGSKKKEQNSTQMKVNRMKWPEIKSFMNRLNSNTQSFHVDTLSVGRVLCVCMVLF